MLKKLLTWSSVLTASALMYNIDWQYGLGTLVLLLSLLGVARLIRGSASWVLVSEEPLSTSKKSLKIDKKQKPNSAIKSKSVIEGLDQSVFKRFREKHQVGGASAKERKLGTDHTKNLYSSSRVSESEKESGQNSSFLNRLEESEQVSVSLSETSRKALANSVNFSLNEEQSADDSSEPDRESESTPTCLKDSDKSSSFMENSVLWNKQLPRIMPQVSQNQGKTESNSVESLVNDEILEKSLDHLFEDLRIPLPAEEQSENESKVRKPWELSQTNEEPNDPDGWPSEDLSRFFQKSGPLPVNGGRVRSFLKMAIDSAEAGKRKEDKDNPENYFSKFDRLENPDEPKNQNLIKGLELQENADNQTVLVSSETVADKLHGSSNYRITEEKKKQSAYATIMDELIVALENKQSFSEALPLLEDLLDYNKQRGDLPAIDALFERLERAHLELGNKKKLIEVYEKHIEFKRKLSDCDGEKKLFDLLNTHCQNIFSSQIRNKQDVVFSAVTIDDQ